MLFYVAAIIFPLFIDTTASVDVTIHLTAPVSNVEEKAILSIHCQIWNLQEGHEVSMFRLPYSGSSADSGANVPKRLTLGDDVSTEDERVFLATRTPMDGSTIYFLSIMDVSTEDTGNYSCRVTSYSGVIADKTLPMNIRYFPDENANPVCSTVPRIHEGFVLYPGQQLVINCSSERGNPAVTMGWNNTANSRINSRDIVHVEGDKTVFSELTLRSSARRIKAVYICTIKSENFPKKEKKCHVGPIDILPDPNLQFASEGDTSIIPPSSLATTAISVQQPKPEHTDGDSGDGNTWDGEQETSLVCRQQCHTTWSQDTFYWIVATMTAVVIAFLLFITCVVLFIKYNRIPSYEDPKCITVVEHPHNRDDIYTELDCRRSDNKLYLAIEKREGKTQQQSSKCELREFHYNIDPNTQTMQQS